jgi:hypothetical protein
VNKAVDDFVAAVKNGKELALDIVIAHGGQPTPINSCGDWTTGGYENYGLDRATVHKKVYGAVKGNACAWVTQRTRVSTLTRTRGTRKKRPGSRPGLFGTLYALTGRAGTPRRLPSLRRRGPPLLQSRFDGSWISRITPFHDG